MEKFFDHISDAAIKFRIVQREDTGKFDLQAICANKHTEFITNVSNDLIINKNLSDVFPSINSIFDWPKIISEAAMTNESKIIEQYVVAFEKYLRFNIFGYKDGIFDIIITDLTEKKEIKRRILERDRQIKHLEAELKARANVEMLTKLYNFQFITDCVMNSIESYNDEGVKFCILLVDIDNFKEINLKYGFEMGDTVLQDVARILSSIARKIDVVGRYGSDKFILILNNLEIDIAKILVEKLKQDIKRHSMKLQGTEISVSGVLMEYVGEPIENLLNVAEMKMGKAKSLGKGTIIS